MPSNMSANSVQPWSSAVSGSGRESAASPVVSSVMGSHSRAAQDSERSVSYQDSMCSTHVLHEAGGAWAVLFRVLATPLAPEPLFSSFVAAAGWLCPEGLPVTHLIPGVR